MNQNQTTAEWCEVKGFEGAYEVSASGLVRSVNRCVIDSRGHRKQLKGRILSPGLVCGYRRVVLCLADKSQNLFVHRLVASAFIKNPQNKKEVNHIDGNKLNNCVENLEWVTRSENALHAFAIGKTDSPYGVKNRQKARRGENSLAKKLYQFDLSGQLIRVWPSFKDANDAGFNTSNIYSFLHGRFKQMYQSQWSYTDSLQEKHLRKSASSK